MKFPKCSADCHRDEVDVGVGVIFATSGWKNSLDEKDGAIDQFGGYHPPGSALAAAYRFAQESKKQ